MVRAKLVITRHHGASFVAMRDPVHVWFSGPLKKLVLDRWLELEELGLSRAPVAHELAQGQFHACASVYPLAPLPLIEQWLTCHEQDRAELLDQLVAHAHDAGVYARSYALHRERALARGWPAHVYALGRQIGVLFGMGRLHRVSSMNISWSAPSLAGLVGSRKCAGRDWLASIGLPIAPGGLAASPRAAVSIAEKVGWPVVLKRPIGGNGDGVMLPISDAAQCAEAASRLLSGSPHIIVEKMLRGEELRIHLVCGKIWEVRRVAKRRIVADGQSTLAELIASQHGGFWRNVLQFEWMQARLVSMLWATGVRTFSDLDAAIPVFGSEIIIGSGVQTGEEGLAPSSAFSRADRKQIEQAFELLGSPSGGVDVLLSTPGSMLAEGGAILEVNIPCGMAYLSSPEDAAEAELNTWFRPESDFCASKGRIPFVVVAGSRTESGQTSLGETIRQRWKNLLEVELEGIGGWIPPLLSTADAFLMYVSEKSVMEYGLPLNSNPICYSDQEHRRSGDILQATVANCGTVSWVRSLEALLLSMEERAVAR